MPKDKKEVKKEELKNFVLGYEVRWMKDVGEQHPDYEKVKKEAEEKGLW